MAFSSVTADYTANRFKTKLAICTFAANDLSGTVYTGLTQVVAFTSGLVGTVAGGTADVHPQLMLVGTAFVGTATGTAIGVAASTSVTFARAGAGTSLKADYMVQIIGW